jgi:hypothetical protein
MANIFEQPSVIASVALETLYRQIVLPRLVYTDIVNDMQPGTGGTVTIPKPAVLTARTYDRSQGVAITLDDVDESGVPITMNTNIYSAVPIPDEDATLNIRNFTEQILVPQTQAVAQALESMTADIFRSLPSAPSPTGTNEVQTVTIGGTPTGGTFELSFGGATTAPIAYNASAAAVKSALTALNDLGPSDVTVTLSGAVYTVSFAGLESATDVPQMTAPSSGLALTGGTSPSVTVATSTPGVAAGAGNADVTMVQKTSGDYSGPVRGLTQAWSALTKKNVPQANRYFVGGADIIGALLDDPNLTRVDQSGDTDALQEAYVNRIRGFQVFEANSLDPSVGYAFTREAIAFVTKPPANPRGASASAGVTDNGMTMRWLSDYDAAFLRDRSIVSVLAGGGVVDANRVVRVNLTTA